MPLLIADSHVYLYSVFVFILKLNTFSSQSLEKSDKQLTTWDSTTSTGFDSFIKQKVLSKSADMVRSKEPRHRSLTNQEKKKTFSGLWVVVSPVKINTCKFKEASNFMGKITIRRMRFMEKLEIQFPIKTWKGVKWLLTKRREQKHRTSQFFNFQKGFQWCLFQSRSLLYGLQTAHFAPQLVAVFRPLDAERVEFLFVSNLSEVQVKLFQSVLQIREIRLRFDPFHLLLTFGMQLVWKICYGSCESDFGSAWEAVFCVFARLLL